MIKRTQKLILFFSMVLLSAGAVFAQEHQKIDIPSLYSVEIQAIRASMRQNVFLTNDTSIDVRFYHLTLAPEIDSAYLTGQASILLVNLLDGNTACLLDFAASLTVDSIVGVASFLHSNDTLQLNFENPLAAGESQDFTVFYHGRPPLANDIKGMHYATHGNDEPVIATLSTPYLAHLWFPCKDGTADKADSVAVDIRLPKRFYADKPLKGLSNGVLDSISETAEELTYHWKHRHAIVPYYVMAAISNYTLIEQDYCGNQNCFPLHYHVFSEDSAAAAAGVAEMPEVMSFFETVFGSYPYADEQYGMTQLGFYGAIENQTNSVMNSMEPGWFLVSVHELSHMWFGCNITCKDWHHGWLNEGFATYAEALWQEHTGGWNAYAAHMASKGWYQGGTVYLEQTNDPFQIFIPIIYNKGAWVLHMLRGVLGDEQFFPLLATYAQHTAFINDNPDTEDFRNFVETETGFDLEVFFEQWVYDAYFPMYYYNFTQDDQEFTLQIYQAQGESGKRTVFEMPIQVLLTFSDASDTLIRVQNDQQWQQFSLQLEKTVVEVSLDPNQWILHSATYVPDLPVGFPQRQKKQEIVRFYPNPASSKLMVELMNTPDEHLSIRLFEMNGAEVKAVQLTTKHKLLDLSDLPPGIYLIGLFTEKGERLSQRKLIRI